MDLKIKDVVDLLNVSEATLRRWVNEGKIPAYRLNQQIRFSRIEVENWMMGSRLGKQDASQSELETPQRGQQHFSLYRAIHWGGVIHDQSSTSKEEIIRKTVLEIFPKIGLDANVISELLLDRENLMPTALNHGIAVPHTRDFLLEKPFDLVTIVYPKTPMDWGSLDEKPVHTLFFLFASDDKRHLHLLAKIAHLNSNEEALEFLKTQPSQKNLLEYVKAWESKLTR